MIVVYHYNNKVISINDIVKNEVIPKSSSTVIGELFELSVKFPNRFIIWCDKHLKKHLNKEVLRSIFHHKLIMSSYNIEECIFNSKVGYVDQSTFIKVNKGNVYSTWMMSSDVGGIHSEVLNKFQHLNGFGGSFKLFLNYISKQGVPQGLITSSNPRLLKKEDIITNYKSETITVKELFRFVNDNYKKVWSWLLLFQLIIYEKKFPILSFLNSILGLKKYSLNTNLSQIVIKKPSKEAVISKDFSVDVIIPTLGRKAHLKNVLLDLNKQTLLPKKVIIVEQNPNENETSELDYLSNQWNFEIDHTFTHRLGACNARNIALSKVNSNFVFLADDDIRFKDDLLEEAFLFFKTYNNDAIVMSCLQKNQQQVFKKTTLATAFGSGTSIIKAEYCKKASFKKEHELGFGEDADFGMQLKQMGAIILYAPNLRLLHLKAPVGGFRFKLHLPWQNDNPKPSPTIMAYQLKHLTQEQLRGYKTLLFFKFYKLQANKNVFSYYKSMKKRWNVSVFWAKKLINDEV